MSTTVGDPCMHGCRHKQAIHTSRQASNQPRLVMDDFAHLGDRGRPQQIRPTRANREASTARACPRSRRHPIRNSSASTEPPARSLARTDETTEGKEAQLHSAVRQMWTRLGITKNQQSQNRPEPLSKSRSLKKLHASHTSRPVVEAFE